MNISMEEKNAVLALCLMASLADGDKHERECEEIKRVAQGFSQGDAVQLSSITQDVLMNRVSLASVAQQLQSAEAKRLAFEMAVCVCDADGALSASEQRFLGDARVALGLNAETSADFVQQAQAVAAMPLPDSQSQVAMSDAGPVDRAGAKAALPARDEARLDQSILNASIANGALELLPESLSTMAIIPLQMKLVWQIGKAYGYELDRGHIKDFLATAGVGLTSQYLEQAGRKLLGGLLGKVGGGLLRGVGQQAVSTGMSFATTFALGHVAKRYYAGGRTLSSAMLKDAYEQTVQDAQGLRTRYLPDMQAKARTLDIRSVMSLVRGA